MHWRTSDSDYGLALKERRLVFTHHKSFIKHFKLPKWIEGFNRVWFDDNTCHVEGRVKVHYKSVKGHHQQFEVPIKKFNMWRNNIGLYAFIENE